MNFKELAKSLEIEKYPALFEEIYNELPEDDGELYDVKYLTELHEKYNMFGNYLEPVLRGVEDLKTKPELILWGRIIVEYNKRVTMHEAKKATFPTPDGSPARDMLPILVLMPIVPLMVKRYEDRGFSDAQIYKNMENFRINLWVLELVTGTVKFSAGMYNWLCNYTYAYIFDHKGFNYQPHIWQSQAIILKNKKSGEAYPMMLEGSFHRDGLGLGSAGCEDEEGSFTVTFAETPEAFYGHLVKGGRVESTSSVCKKSEWECIVRPGDDVVSLHIPRNTNLDPDYVSESFKEGMELTRKFYPELSPKFLACSSWLMDSTLSKILGPDAKLSKFTDRFIKYPQKSAGNECLGYVYPGFHCEVKDYPEDTRLRREIKKLMLNNTYIHWTNAIIPEEM